MIGFFSDYEAELAVQIHQTTTPNNTTQHHHQHHFCRLRHCPLFKVIIELQKAGGQRLNRRLREQSKKQSTKGPKACNAGTRPSRNAFGDDQLCKETA